MSGHGLIFSYHEFVSWERRGCLICGRAKWRHRPRPITVVKPSGYWSVMATETQGIHPPFPTEPYIRRPAPQAVGE